LGSYSEKEEDGSCDAIENSGRDAARDFYDRTDQKGNRGRKIEISGLHMKHFYFYFALEVSRGAAFLEKKPRWGWLPHRHQK
jgi:hypothetical protein